jgi:hypothetical protein
MRRTLLLVLGFAAALLLAPAAFADSTTTKIIRDCADDGVLEGHYTPAELRKARDNLPTDVNEYSDCSDVLSRALAADVSSAGGHPAGGGGGGTPGAAPTATPAPQYSDTTVDQSGAVIPDNAADQKAVADASRQGGEGDVIEGRPLAPAAAVAGRFGRNSLPATLVIVLVLLAGAALSFVVPTIRRRVRARRAP